MSALLKLRPYQTEAIDALRSRWDAGEHRLAVVLPTGAGKTVVFAHLIADWIRETVSKRALVLVHTDELVQQAYKKIKDVAPDLHVGIVKAERNEVTARVIVASVQSLRSAKRREQIRNVGLVVCDEVHHCVAATYRAIFDHFGCMDGRTPLAGFTATLARGDNSKISDVIQGVAFQRGIAWAIRRGYLLDVRGKSVVIPEMDLSAVKRSGGDYQDGALAQEMERSLAPSLVAEEYLKYAQDRKGIAFWPTVEVAEHAAAEFREAGIPSETIHGKLPREIRRAMLRRLHSGETQVVHGVGVLTEGFDDPTISCVVMARPTTSAPLYQQCVGRGLRPDLSLPPESRGDCLVLDVVGVSRTHNLRTLIDLSSRPLEEVDDGTLSLLEMEELLTEQEERVREDLGPIEEYYGNVQAEDFDPLARTGIGAWLKTDGGTFFLPVGKEAYVLIVESEDPGQFDVAWLTQSPGAFLHKDCGGREAYVWPGRTCSCGLNHEGSQGDLTEHKGLSLDMACSWAEEVMEELGGSTALLLAGTGKRWRRGEVSDPQRRMAARYGIELTGQESKGDVADLISTRMGSRRIDPVVGMMLASRA